MKKLLLVAGMIGAVAVANAATFERITSNAPEDIASQLQFSVAVNLVGERACFRIANETEETTGQISEIYFDDTSSALLVSIGDFDFGTGENIVYFTDEHVTPENLPGGNTVGFEATLRAGAVNGNGGSNRIGPEEYLGICVNLVAGKGLDDVLAALENGTLRIGLHVQSIGEDGEDGDDGLSDSFVSGPPPPEPPQVPDASATAMLLGLALLGLEGLRRRMVK